MCHCQGACAPGNLRRKIMRFVGEGHCPSLVPHFAIARVGGFGRVGDPPLRETALREG